MKNMLLTLLMVFMGLILAAGMVEAYDSILYNNVGFGLESTATIGSSPVSFGITSGLGFTPFTYIYFQTPESGNVSLALDMNFAIAGGGGDEDFTISGLNYTSGTGTWTTYYSGWALGRRVINLSAYSNVGIFRINLHCVRYTTQILYATLYPETSSFELNGVADYSSHSYMAGGKYTIPLVNRFYPQTTYVYGHGIDIGVPVTATNASGFYYTTFQSSCSSSSGIVLADVDNWFEGVPGAIQQYSFYVNMTSITPLNFTVYSPATTPNISLAAGESKTFSVAYSPLESLSAVAWYVNHGLVQYGANTTYIFNESAPGTYFLECQLEDNTCSQYPTIGWYISVGKTTSISGSTWGILGGLTSALPYTSISLFNTSLGISTSTVSDGFGDYVFSGLPAGGYNLTASKTGYYPVSAMVVTYYGYFSNTNFNKNFILTGGAPTTTTTTTTIATTTTLYAGCIGSLTEDCAYYYNDSLSCSLRYACAGGYCFQCAYSVPNYCFADQLCSATTTTSTTSGTTSTTSGTTSTTSGTTSTTSGTTSTTGGTTTTIPTTTSSTSAPATTLNSTANYHPTPASYDCSNVTAHVYAGNWTQASWCAFVLPLGGEWAVAMVLVFCCFVAYTSTKNYTAVVLTALLLSTAFVQLYPPIMWTIIIPFAVAIGITVVFFFIYNKPRRKHSTAYTEDFGE